MITDIGIHRVQHGDIMNGLDELMEGDKADFIYSDPPWGQGNLTYWQTMNKKNDRQRT
jgi:16S rRNA G966 N2-methylase RsmD